MATYSKGLLSGSTHGRGIKVTQTAISTGDTIHTAVASTIQIDLVTIFAYNDDTVARTLVLGWGGTTAPDNVITVTLQPQAGLNLVVSDLPLRNGLAIRAAASVANVIIIYGWVNQIR